MAWELLNSMDVHLQTP